MIEERFARLRAVIASWEAWESEREKEFRALFERGDGPAIRQLMEEMRTVRQRRKALESFVERWSGRQEPREGGGVDSHRE
jgi:hypothetical protein